MTPTMLLLAITIPILLIGAFVGFATDKTERAYWDLYRREYPQYNIESKPRKYYKIELTPEQKIAMYTYFAVLFGGIALAAWNSL